LQVQVVYVVIFLLTLLDPLSFDGFREGGIGLKHRDCNNENTAGGGNIINEKKHF